MYTRRTENEKGGRGTCKVSQSVEEVHLSSINPWKDDEDGGGGDDAADDDERPKEKKEDMAGMKKMSKVK